MGSHITDKPDSQIGSKAGGSRLASSMKSVLAMSKNAADESRDTDMGFEKTNDLSLFSMDDEDDEADQDLVYETRVSNGLHS